MVGNRQRNVYSIYQRTHPAAPAADEPLDRRRRRSGCRRQPPPPMPCEEEDVVAEDEEELVRQMDEEREARDEDDEEEAIGMGFASSSSLSVYLQGPTSLPSQRSLPHQRLVIRLEGQK
jgi:hypothetical protein